MKRKKARPVNPADFDLTSLISRADAVRLIVQEVAQPNERTEQVRTRVSQRIRYAVRIGKLRTVAPSRFRYGQLVAWAQDTWPRQFVGWSVTRPHVVHPGTGIVQLPLLQPNGVGRVLPSNTLEGWRSYAERLEAENLKLATEFHSLGREIVSLRREIQQLRPYKVRFDETREKRRAAGKRGGRRRIREN